MKVNLFIFFQFFCRQSEESEFLADCSIDLIVRFAL